jgi:pyruvate dehydrogenase E1 component
VPILVDEARTFGMEGPVPPDRASTTPKGRSTRRSTRTRSCTTRKTNGQILQEGINEAGGMASWIAAATSYSTNNRIMVPFYIYYSMFGFQRSATWPGPPGDMQARGLPAGRHRGRTTLNGEGLQHEDGPQPHPGEHDPQLREL